MKKIFRLVTALSMVCGAFAFTGCTDYSSDIQDLDNRLTSVESTLATLQSKIDAGVVIESVTSGNNGVIITLSNGQSYTISNGRDGADGANGADGQNGTPGTVISISEDGYWVIDGVKTDWPVSGTPGADGTPGTPGADGADAPTIYYYPGTDGFWHKVTVSPEGTETDEVTDILWAGSSEGVTVVYDTENDKLIFSGVSEDGPVVINLKSQLKSLAFVPKEMAQGLGVIGFYQLYKDGEYVASNAPKVTYRLNPANADVDGVDFSFINRDVVTRVAGDNTDLISIENYEVEEGAVVLSIKLNDEAELSADASKPGDHTLVALKATSDASAEEIVSDYALVEQSKVETYVIINKDMYEDTPSVVDAYPTELPALADDPDLALLYNGSLDVPAYLETYSYDVARSLPEIDVYPTYEIELVSKYLGEDNTTDQQKFVSLSEDGVLTVNSEWLDESTRPAIGRTPVLHVESYVADVMVAECYIKVLISEQAQLPQDPEEEIFATLDREIEYSDIPANGFDMGLTWTELNEIVLAGKNMSYQQFVNYYAVNSLTATYKEGNATTWSEVAPVGVNAPVGTSSEDPTATNVVSITITNLIDETATGSVKVVIPAIRSGYAPIAIVFNYTIKHEHEYPAFHPDYLKPGTDNTVQVKGKLDGGKWVMMTTFAEHFEDYLIGYEPQGNHSDIMFEVRPIVNGVVWPMDKEISEIPASAKVDWQDTVTSDGETLRLNSPLVENETYTVTAYWQLANGNYCEMYYDVEFVSPFEVSAPGFNLKTLIASGDTKDASTLVVVTDADGQKVYEKGAVTKYGADTYKLATSDFTFTYGLLFEADNAAYDSEASFGGYLTQDGSKFTWDNGGTTLQQNKHAGYSVELTVSDICTVKAEGAITVLSSANSR